MTAGRLPAAGLLLAGGSSRRMGRDKLSLPWEGKTLLGRIAGVLTATLAETWVVGLPDTTPPPAWPGLRFVTEEAPIGPLGGLQAGLEAMAAPAGIVVAADMPFVDETAIRRLWALSGDAPAAVLRAADGAHPLFGVYRRECLNAVRAVIRRGERRMSALWDEVPVRVLDVGDDPFWTRALFNINSPADYERALRARGE